MKLLKLIAITIGLAILGILIIIAEGWHNYNEKLNFKKWVN